MTTVVTNKGRRAVALFLASLCALLIGLTSAQSASAHSASIFGARWTGGFPVYYGYTPTIPSSWRTPIWYGAYQWNYVNEPFKWSYYTSDYANFNPYTCALGYRQNAMHRYWIDGAGGTLAWAPACWWSGSPATLASAQVVYDSGENYYAGTGTPASNQFDLWSVAVHEIGHAMGFGQNPAGHLTDVCSSAYYAATMCPYFSPGQTYPRGLETHDKHTFQAAY